MTKQKKIIEGHEYFLKIKGVRVKVFVRELIGSYAKVQQSGGKVYACAISQLSKP